MILILTPNVDLKGDEYRRLMDSLASFPGIKNRIHQEHGTEVVLTEVYLIGNTSSLSLEEMRRLPCVERVVRVSEEYRILGRHKDDQRPTYFEYNGVRFGQDNLHVFAGLCAVDTPEHVEMMMKALQENGQICTRMGAYKPRTSPYAFQGHGKTCLPYVFQLAGKYGIKVIAMEITHESHVDEIREALQQTGNPTGVMLQIGTRNTQNFELLKMVGRQQEFPVLIKRGFGITLEESLNAAEYLASEGNRKVVFGLRGMKSNMGDPHRNFVDFAQVPVVKRLTRMPVCIDPSHSVGSRNGSPDGILDVMHATAQGIIAGANMVLVDFHPVPTKALVDGPQALRLPELPRFLEDIRIAREAYEKRVALWKVAGEEAIGKSSANSGQ
ncbi:MAG TPA: 3-deoxy-7-phosphoheptulonate synthase [Verrucomicrobia bacterium]|nr:MAG: 3-deoxy-7-phosphoheptulonate synthase [Lentisphaerae bacterium GWF2_57_35]HBA85739.1 3-deoxy-7-phosphoheptulonate synthase [Verrucomicrobiota bacterium]